MTLGEKIKHERKVFSMGQEELSEKLDVSLKTLQRWESNERSPRVEQIIQLSKIFGLMPEYFLSETKTTPSIVEEEKSEKTKTSENMASLILENGRKITAPATPEGFAFLKDIYLASLKNTAA